MLNAINLQNKKEKQNKIRIRIYDSFLTFFLVYAILSKGKKTKPKLKKETVQIETKNGENTTKILYSNYSLHDFF